MKKTVIINFDIEGTHNYPNPPREVYYLTYEHRHLFKIKCGFNVQDSNREIEIFMQEEIIKTYLKEEYWHVEYSDVCEFGNMSCEMIAEDILNKFGCDWVEVLEDNRGGARVEI
tara:strand:+ start:3446 stop:3787 length:342 start_codon:yes stop_codon:yes gene_type:complete